METYIGSIANAVSAAYGEVSSPLISPSGRSWISFTPDAVIQSANAGKSPISPMPHDRRVRIEKSGTVTPAIRRRREERGERALIEVGAVYDPSAPFSATRRGIIYESPVSERVWTGRPYPLGATYDGVGVNFAVFSESATK